MLLFSFCTPTPATLFAPYLRTAEKPSTWYMESKYGENSFAIVKLALDGIDWYSFIDTIPISMAFGGAWTNGLVSPPVALRLAMSLYRPFAVMAKEARQWK
jgi:hypothetical protein